MTSDAPNPVASAIRHEKALRALKRARDRKDRRRYAKRLKFHTPMRKELHP